jgi:farnesyl-diphosphate farnesyltransferase
VHDLRRVNSESSRYSLQYQSDLDFQARLLDGVSRTFALTIPALPRALASVVANAYLLCRLADTIEDDTLLENAKKSRFHRRLVAVVRGESCPIEFARELAPQLSKDTLAAERELVVNADRVIRVTATFSAEERAAITRCVSRMCSGMPRFQRNKSLDGLTDLEEMAAYCYVVAGVVGEMLTELFCSHCPELSHKRSELMRLSLSFGQGLQMTNILKDIWEDRRAQTCWLPRSVFGDGDFDLSRLEQLYETPEYRMGLEHLIGIAHHHLRNALEYTAQIPIRESGIRRFCVWAIGLAVLTLQKIWRNPHYVSGDRVKISRRSVRATVLVTSVAQVSDGALRLLFNIASTGLPLSRQESFALSSRASGRR